MRSHSLGRECGRCLKISRTAVPICLFLKGWVNKGFVRFSCGIEERANLRRDPLIASKDSSEEEMRLPRFQWLQLITEHGM